MSQLTMWTMWSMFLRLWWEWDSHSVSLGPLGRKSEKEASVLHGCRDLRRKSNRRKETKPNSILVLISKGCGLETINGLGQRQTNGLKVGARDKLLGSELGQKLIFFFFENSALGYSPGQPRAAYALAYTSQRMFG